MSWSKKEDNLLLQLKRSQRKPTMNEISNHFPGRNSKQVAYRYKNLIHGRLKYIWKRQNDNLLMKLVELNGENFELFSGLFPKKSSQDLAIRYYKRFKPEKLKIKPNSSLKINSDLTQTELFNNSQKKFKLDDLFEDTTGNSLLEPSTQTGIDSKLCQNEHFKYNNSLLAKECLMKNGKRRKESFHNLNLESIAINYRSLIHKKTIKYFQVFRSEENFQYKDHQNIPKFQVMHKGYTETLQFMDELPDGGPSKSIFKSFINFPSYDDNSLFRYKEENEGDHSSIPQILDLRASSSNISSCVGLGCDFTNMSIFNTPSKFAINSKRLKTVHASLHQFFSDFEAEFPLEFREKLRSQNEQISKLVDFLTSNQISNTKLIIEISQDANALCKEIDNYLTTLEKIKAKITPLSAHA